MVGSQDGLNKLQVCNLGMENLAARMNDGITRIESNFMYDWFITLKLTFSLDDL